MDIASLTPRVALAVVYAIEHATGVRSDSLQIKWPNDVLYSGCKLVGVLCELVDGALLIGIGINANFEASELPIDSRVPGTTLREVLGNDVDTDVLAVEVLMRLHNMLEAPAWSSQVADVFRSRLAYLGELVRVESVASMVEGTLVGVDDDASLILKTAEREHRFRSGEIVRLRPVATKSAERV